MLSLPVTALPPACPFSDIRDINLLDGYKLLTGRAVSSCIFANSLLDSEEVHMDEKSAIPTTDHNVRRDKSVANQSAKFTFPN